MRRIVILASSVWLAVFVSTTLSTLFWRVGYLRPHALWGLLSLVLMFTPMIWLAASALRRIVCGPCRLRAVGWLLVGATPLVWICAYLTELNLQARTRTFTLTAPARVTLVWLSSMMDIEARRRYSRWTRGRYAVLMDDGQTPTPEKLVAEMDNHIQVMSDLLGQPVPEMEFPWVRGSLFGLNRLSIAPWALCGQGRNPGELTDLDRHEVAHSLINALSSPDGHPPSLLGEGWAESQSWDRNEQIRNLAKKRQEGLTCSLQEMVGPDRYHRGGPAYWEGGPVVNYLMERYGPKTFFRLYSGTREDSFHDDCQAILGDSWETVEEDFWKWIEAEKELLPEADVDQPDAAPAVDVELAQSVDPADWQALVEGYREANKDSEPLPSNTAFVIETERAETDVEAPDLAKRTEHEFRAVFEDGQFWIFENFASSVGWFLMATTERCANLHRNESGSFDGWVKGGWGRDAARLQASELLSIYRREADPAYSLPLRENPWAIEATCQIERVVRPTEGRTGRWTVWFTRRQAKYGTETRCEIELDPGQRWWITRSVKRAGEWRSEMTAESERVGDAFIPVTLHIRFARDRGERNVRWRVRPMLEGERQELKQRIEQAARRGPRVAYQRLRHFLLVIVIACPLGGVTLLGITRRPPATTRACPGQAELASRLD